MNNKFPQIHLIYNRYKKASNEKPAVVEIRVTHNYQQKYISTGVWLYPNQWDRGRIVNCDNTIEISQTLERMVTDVRQTIYDMAKEGRIDIRQIPDRLNAKNRSSLTFLDFCKERAAVRKYGKARDTQERYDRFIRLFSVWGKIRTFEDIRDEKIIAYDKHLTKKGMKANSRWNNYHRFLNGFIQDAIKEGLLKRNPYQWVNIDKNKKSLGLDKCLTPSEFRQLRDAKMPTDSLERVRDLFVFQTYTCLRYSDLSKFNHNNITIINGIETYRFTQKKTRNATVIPLLQPALDVLNKYKGFLPVISNVKYNAYLKVVAQAAGLPHKLSTHWARHTGATMLLNEGVDMKIVSRICGHSSLRITEQIYAKLLDETVVDAIESVKDKLGQH